MTETVHVLFIEDSESDVELAIRHIRDGGINCMHRVVDCEAQLRKALQTFNPHVVLSDFSVPKFDGQSALQIVLRETPGVPFIFLSGTMGEERAIEALHGGAVDYVLKTNLARLAPAVKRALREASERKQQQEKIERLSRALRMHSGINSAVTRIRDRDELLQEACRLAVEVGGHDRAIVSLVEPQGRLARVLFRAGGNEGFPEPAVFTIADGSEPDTSLTGRALRTGEIAVCSDFTQSEPPVAERQPLIDFGYRSMLALPLVVDSEKIGALTLVSRNVRLVSDEELSLFQDITANLSLAIRSQHREDTVQFLESFDPLTGLARRPLFCARITRLLAQRAGPIENLAVVAFDLHHLSNINDSFGRHVGDLILQSVADRLRHHVREDSDIGYLGGGTFVMVFPHRYTSDENISALLEGAVLREPFYIEGRSLRVSGRSGITRCPTDGREGGILVQHAEAALKRARESGEQYLHYQIQMHSELARRLALEHKLRDALDAERFELHYQPQIDIATGRITSVEALLRWLDPEAGVAMPMPILQVLESSGMIVPIGNWALRRAAEDCRAWRERGIGPVRIAVNVSAIQIRRRNFVESVLDRIGSWTDCDYGIDLEITESGFLDDIEDTSRKLLELRKTGIRIAIDDFGTGYSTLGLLSKLPVDTLKIDRSFISGLPADAASVTLVSSIVGIASAFDLIAVAEGVETVAQLALLRELKCHRSQGFLHARPMPAQQLESLLRERCGESASVTRPAADTGAAR